MTYRLRMRLSTGAMVCAIGVLAACNTTSPGVTSDACGASQYQNLVGGLSRATTGLDIPPTSRHYVSEETVATNNPNRLNFVHSGTAVESVTDPASTVVRVFCG